MKTSLTILTALASFVISGCDKPISAVHASGNLPGSSPFEVHAPVYSVRVENGKYRIDSSVVWEGKNKARLLEELEKQKLSDKNSISEMPGFMRTFFDGLYNNKKMEIADPGQEWKDGVPEIRLFDKTGKPLNSPLPNKKLVYLGVGKDIALFSYFIGDSYKSQEMIIVRFSGDKVTDLYFDRNSSRVTDKMAIVDYLKHHQNQGGC